MKRQNLTLYFTVAKYQDKKYQVTTYKHAFKNLDKDKMKTWKHWNTCARPCGKYETGIVSIYKTRTPGVYALVSYYDGCFYPLVCYSRLCKELIQDTKDWCDYCKEKSKEYRKAI